MKILKKFYVFIFDKIDRILTSIFAIIGAFYLIQFPNFFAQYLQRLGGHIDESKLIAARTKLPAIIARSKELLTEYKKLENSSFFSKLPNFIVNVDLTIAQKTLKKFTPGLLFSKESIYYLLIGIILGIFSYCTIKLGIKKLINKVFKKKSQDTPQTTPINNTNQPDNFNDIDLGNLDDFNNIY